MVCFFRKSTRFALLRGALVVFAATPGIASAQFVFDDSHNASTAGSGVDFVVGVQNGANDPDYTFSDSSSNNGGANLSAKGDQLDTNYGATHHGVGSASMSDVSTSGGISLSGSFETSDTLLTAGGNSFFSGIAYGEFGVDEGFYVTTTGDYALVATGTRSNTAYASPYGDGTSYFRVALQDRSTSNYLISTNIDYTDEYSVQYNPLNTTVHLVAGDYYELNSSAYALSAVGYPDAPGSNTTLDYGYSLQLGNPAAVPEAPGFLPLAGLLGVVRRRRSIKSRS